ncbi:MFS transporter [Streptomyces sp. NPDC057718]|uniref:MFS transporter n=1 Tax=Streptomyces sp. NPDC057718 TaxID=3346225 RepID=UPI00368F7888
MPPTAEPTQVNHRATYREVLAEPRFRLLFSTRAVAITADALRITTFSVLVFSSTGSALLSAVAFGIGFIPQLFGSLLLGSLADRLPPRALITGGYALTCATALLLAVVRMPVAASLGVVALVSLATPVFHGASSRLVAQSLKGDAYVLGRSLSNVASAGAQLLGLALGGAAVAALGPRRALAVSAVLYVGCALAIRIRLPRLQPAAFGGTPGSTRGSTGGDSGADRGAGGGAAGGGAGGGAADDGAVRASLQGAGLLLRDRKVRRLMLAQWLPVALVAGAEGLVVAYAGERRFAPGRYAVLMGCLPVGMLVGDLLVGRFLRPRTRERLVVPLAALAGLPLIGFAAEPGVGVSACLLLISGLGYAYGLGLQRPFLDALPQNGRGQAFGLLGSGSMTLQGVGPVCLGTAAAAGTGTGGAIALAGGAVALTAGWILTWHPRTSPAPSPASSPAPSPASH